MSERVKMQGNDRTSETNIICKQLTHIAGKLFKEPYLSYIQELSLLHILSRHCFHFSCILKWWVAHIITFFAMYITSANAKKEITFQKGSRFSTKTKRLFSHITLSTILKRCCFQKLEIFLAGEGKQDPCLLLS